jgi:tetratricopeptide (TPR) repeat protein
MSSEPNWLEFFEDRERLYANYYLDFAQQHARRDPEAYGQLEAESGNLLKTASWLAEHDEAEDILKLASALWQQSDFMRSRGFMQRGLPLLEQARRAARRLRDSRAEVIWLEALAYTHNSKGNPAVAQPLLEQALALAQEIDEPKLRAQAQLEMGRLLMERGQLDDAAIWLKQALQNYRQAQEYTGEIETLTALGNLLSLQGDFTGAVTYLEQGLPLAQARQDRHGEVALRFALGYVATAAQDWSTAIIHYELVIDMARAIGDHFYEVRGLHNLAEAWLELGQVQQAVTLLEKSLALQEISDDIMAKAFTRFYLAKAYHALNDLDNSLIQWNDVYPYLLESRQAPILAALAAEAAWIRADIFMKQSNINLARLSLKDVLDIAPDHMVEIRQAAKTLFESLEKATKACELDYDDIENR